MHSYIHMCIYMHTRIYIYISPHRLSEPTVLRKHARHYLTDEVIPDELLEKIFAARNFNLGFDTIEYTVCALVDQGAHMYICSYICSYIYSYIYSYVHSNIHS